MEILWNMNSIRMKEIVTVAQASGHLPVKSLEDNEFHETMTISLPTTHCKKTIICVIFLRSSIFSINYICTHVFCSIGPFHN